MQTIRNLGGTPCEDDTRIFIKPEEREAVSSALHAAIVALENLPDTGTHRGTLFTLWTHCD